LKSFSWTLALRYLNPLRTFVSVITLISLAGVAFGVMVLIVVLSVHNGFERDLKDTLLGQSPHLSLYSKDGQIVDWENQEKALSENSSIKSAYALVEGYALLDSRSWQRPVAFRAFNTRNKGQIKDLEGLLDPDYPGSSVDFNPPIEDAMAAPSLEVIEESGDDGESLRELDAIETEEIYGNRLAVISSQLADALGIGPGDEVRLVSASNLDQVMKVYSLPADRAWDLYSDTFESFEENCREMFQILENGEERVPVDRLRTQRESLNSLLIRRIETPDGPIYEPGEPMREVERQKISEIVSWLEVNQEAGEGEAILEAGTQEAVLEQLAELRELDLEEADNEEFQNIREFVLPISLKVQGVYKVSERSQGPDLFIPVEIGMELKGLQGAAQSMGIRIEDPYRAAEFEAELQATLGPNWIVQSWMRMHADRFQLVKTEKIMMSFALSFITLLSAFSIMAVMYTVTVQKRQEIGVMKALGATPSQIVRVFVYQGAVVGVGGAVLGLGLGLLAIRYREAIMSVIRGFGVDPFPAEFHGMAELPAYTDWMQLTIICVVAVVLCLKAALVPALMAAFRDPAKSLRNL
jgi:lipoprotein-releasing system permease protein